MPLIQRLYGKEHGLERSLASLGRYEMPPLSLGGVEG